MTVFTRPMIFLTGGGIADPEQEHTLAELRDRLAQPGAKLLLHLHGGLVSETSGRDGANRLAGIGDRSWKLDDEWIQLYVVWRTGVRETLEYSWPDLLHNDRLYQTVLRKLIGFIARRIGIAAPGGARSADETFKLDELEIQRRITGLGTLEQRRDPFHDVEKHFGASAPAKARAMVMVPKTEEQLAEEFEDELREDDDFQLAVADIDKVVNSDLPGRAALAPGDEASGKASLDRLAKSVQAQFEPRNTPQQRRARGPVSVAVFIAKHAGQIAYRCFKRFRSERDHGFHATIVEELCREMYADLLGATVWGMMVKDAADHFVAGAFGQTLIDILAAAPQPERFVVTGHSAGSIWATRLLQAMSERRLDRKLDLFLLAPAVRRDLFADAIAASEPLIGKCRIFTMNDELERKDAVLGHDKGYIYPSSLLYCVSGMFEQIDAEPYSDAPLLGMWRFTGTPWLNPTEAEAEATIARFFALPDKDVILAPSPGISMADCHGCFDDEPLTLKSVAALF